MPFPNLCLVLRTQGGRKEKVRHSWTALNHTAAAHGSPLSQRRPAGKFPLPPPVTQATRFPLFDMQTVSVAL